MAGEEPWPISAIRPKFRCPSTSRSRRTRRRCGSTLSWTERRGSLIFSNPEAPKQVYSKKIGAQVNMVSQSWDGKRVYFTSSLLANWDKKGADNEQFLKGYSWDGKELEGGFRRRLP